MRRTNEWVLALALGVRGLCGCSASSATPTGADASAADSSLNDSAPEVGVDAETGDVEAGAEAGATCIIGGTTYASGDANPEGFCQSCQPPSSTTAWTNLPNDAGCAGSWGVCRGGSCVGSAVGLSCAAGGAGMTNCGGGSESCCTSLDVDGGAYPRTYVNDGSGASGQADYVTVSGLRLDKYEVTVGRFRQFVKAWNGGGGWLPPAGSGKHTHLNLGQGLANGDSAGTYETGWDPYDDLNLAPTDANLTSACDLPSFATWTPAPGSQENLPINCVTWAEAYAFCIWDGGFLPSVAEWELAAAAGNQQREYPWGSTAPGTSNQYAIYGCYYPDPSASDGGWGDCIGTTNLAPVGSAPAGAGAFGQLDLGGNVWETCVDYWNETYPDVCTDCADLSPTSTGNLACRGGSFGQIPAYMSPPFNGGWTAPTDRLHQLGMRCARSP
jgi:formylglycine-generating enzyme required for sulfatase activity